MMNKDMRVREHKLLPSDNNTSAKIVTAKIRVN